MKKIGIALIISLVLVSMVIKPKAGCVDNSYHLTQKYDSKEYHYVQCHCPCDTHAAFGLKSRDRNKCLECGHYHYPSAQSFNTAQSNDPRKSALQTLIVKYQRSQRP